MARKKYDVELDEYEQEIEDNFGRGEIVNDPALFKRLQEAATRHVEARQSITIRVVRSDLNAIKRKASKLALPYQTYINMLIHNDAMSA